jgi:SAM-dependent methyltransferase
MSDTTWEDMISINSRADTSTETLGRAVDYLHQDRGDVAWDRKRIPLDLALANDGFPIPTTAQREGYYGDNHFNYWASGLRDYCQLVAWMTPRNLPHRTLLDMGCATGRFLRHAHADFTEVIGCDINRKHVDWIGQHLGSDIRVFQNTSVPSLPLPDESVDVVTGFSVFTHIECFDTTWLMELRRILRPDGIAWLIEPSWPLYPALTSHPDYAQYRNTRSLPADRLVFRWHTERSYSANVFYTERYIQRTWGRILTFRETFPALPHFQDVVVLQKTS